MKENKKLNVKLMVQIALVTALICVLAPLSIPLPFSPVPISLTILAIYFGLYAIGWKWGTVACLLYILLGLIGVPVFSGFSSGPAKLFGPTGGYIFGFIFVAIIAGIFIDKFEKKIWMHIIGMVIGVAVCYIFGTAWFLVVMDGYTVSTALAACVIPFIPADIVKIIIAILVGPAIRKGIKKINQN